MAVAVSVVAAVSSLLPPVRSTLPRISARATTAATARAMIRLRLRPLFSDGGFGTGGIGMQSACRPMPARGQTVFNGGVDANQRRRRLVEAGIAITSELSLDAVLQTLVRIAAELTGARYSALGVIDRGGHRVGAVPLTYGIDDAHAGRDRRASARARHPRRADSRTRGRCASRRSEHAIHARSASRRTIRRCTASSVSP